MITTVHVAIFWPKDKGNGVPNSGGPELARGEQLSIRDPRVLLGVQQVLAQRPGVTQAPDLVAANANPYFAVAFQLSDTEYLTEALSLLTEPVRLRIAFAADGGWKTVLVDIDVEVI